MLLLRQKSHWKLNFALESMEWRLWQVSFFFSSKMKAKNLQSILSLSKHEMKNDQSNWIQKKLSFVSYLVYSFIICHIVSLYCLYRLTCLSCHFGFSCISCLSCLTCLTLLAFFTRLTFLACLYICLSVCLYVCLSLSLYLFVFISI
jgi:hypothetical protein